MRCLLLILFAVTIAGCGQRSVTPGIPVSAPQASNQTSAPASDPLAPIAKPRANAEKIVNGAKTEARRGVLYDASYKRIAYPNGDVAPDRGACTDVLIRALRNAGIDIQQRIHEDMKNHFDLYPRRKDLARPDTNIDHRRVTNHLVFMRRFGKTLPIETTGKAKESWQPGDLVYWKLDSGLDHCGVLSNVRNADGLPLVIHNLSRAAQEDCLTSWKIVGHFRYPQ